MKYIILLSLLFSSTLSLADNEDCVREIIDNSIYETYTNECVCGNPMSKTDVENLFEGVEDLECYNSLRTADKNRIQVEKEAQIKACLDVVNQSCGRSKKSKN